MTASSVIRDQNRIPIWWGVSSVDGVTLVPIVINSATGRAKFENGISTMPVMAAIPETIPRDENRVTALAAQSNASLRIIPVSVNPATGGIQVQST